MRVVRVFFALAICGTSCGLAASAEAAWTPWYSIGGSIVGEPSIVNSGVPWAGVAVVARGLDDALWWTGSEAEGDGTTFRSWESLGGIVTSPPSCVSRGGGVLDCYVRGTDSGIIQRRFIGTSWSEWIYHGGQIYSNPAAIGKFAESTVIYAISVTTLFDRRWIKGVGWAPWQAVPADLLPAGTSLECDQSPFHFKELYRVLCLFRSPDNAISGFEGVVRVPGHPNPGGAPGYLPPTLWQGSLPDIPQSAFRPDVVLNWWDSGHVFVVALDGTLRTATWKSGVGFGEWENLGGFFTSGPSCDGRPGPDYTIICAGRGGDGAVWVARKLK
jgi:hypothetical protein